MGHLRRRGISRSWGRWRRERILIMVLVMAVVIRGGSFGGGNW